MWEASVHNYLKIGKMWVSLPNGYCLGGLQLLKAVWLRVNFLRKEEALCQPVHTLPEIVTQRRRSSLLS